jgi:hypothetical protein
MLLNYSNQLCLGYFLLTLILYACAGYAYRVNALRATNDPNRRKIPVAAVLLGPIMWPVLLFGVISIFLIKVLVYSIFLILFAIALIVIRKPLLITWLKNAAVWIGDRLLEANTLLLKLVFGDPEKKTKSSNR